MSATTATPPSSRRRASVDGGTTSVRLPTPMPPRLLITANAGHFNGYRTRLWKVEPAKLTNRTGLKVRAQLDHGYYPIGIKVADKQLAAVPLTKHASTVTGTTPSRQRQLPKQACYLLPGLKDPGSNNYWSWIGCHRMVANHSSQVRYAPLKR